MAVPLWYSQDVDEERVATLTSEEVWDLIESILIGVEHVEEGLGFPATWPAEMRDWCYVLLTRMYEEEPPIDSDP